MVGDKECDIGDGFYIYFTTKLPNPAFSPEVSIAIPHLAFQFSVNISVFIISKLTIVFFS